MKFRGIILAENKDTEDSNTATLPCPKSVSIAMLQHMGVPCKPLVNVGDTICVGDKIGDYDTSMCCPVHSSVSGKVTAIVDTILENNQKCKSIEIECDGFQTMSPKIAPPKITNKTSFIKAVRDSGCCGLGGAGFPTHVKLDYDKDKVKIDTLILNGAECEPYITCDYHEMIENADGIISGAKLLKNFLDIENIYIGIQADKTKVISIIEEKIAGEDNIELVRLPELYPQGAEKIIAYTCTGRIISDCTQAADHGIIVINVSTVAFINEYVNTGVPLVSRNVTIDGDAINTSCNVKAPIGTKVSDLLEFTDTNPEAIHKFIAGGVMMGICLPNFDFSLRKTHNAFIALKKPVFLKKSEKEPPQTNCIRCGRCIDACPLGLMPTQLEKAFDKKNIDKLKQLKVDLCMNCGSCSYVCPAKRDLAEKNQLAKILAFESKEES